MSTKIAFLLAAVAMVFSITIAPSVYAQDLTNTQSGENNTRIEAGGDIQMDENDRRNTNSLDGGVSIGP
jgi:hypothetical protein